MKVAVIKYNGSIIALPEAGQIVTLKCAGKKMIDDLIMEVAGINNKGMAISWEKLLDEEIITVDNGVIYSENPQDIYGTLILPNDGSITSIGDAVWDMSSENQEDWTMTGRAAFKDGYNMTGIVIPDSVINIGANAFAGCINLTSISFNGTIEQWGAVDKGEFWNTGVAASYVQCLDGRTDYVLLPGLYSSGAIETYRSLGVEAVSDKMITPWSTLVNNGDMIVDNGQVYPRKEDDNANIPGYAIEGDLVLPDGYTIYTIPEDAFNYQQQLTDILLPNSIKVIQANSFRDCVQLKSVNIPESVTDIEYSAFLGCENLAKIYYNAVECADSYKNEKSFGGTGSLVGTQFIIGSSVRKIPAYLLQAETTDDYNITHILFEEGSVCETIGENAFQNLDCTDITIPNSVINIGASAFNGSYFANVVIGNSVTSIGGGAFISCSSLTSIAIPDSVTSIGDQVFRNCSSLTSVTIGNSVTSIGKNAFSGCSSLTNIEIPDSITSINYGMFALCSGLTNITIPDSVTSIGDQVFSYCSGLTSVTIGNSVTSIGISAFFKCSGLTNITIPDSVTSIGKSAFANCTGLANIVFNGTAEQWNNISKGSNWNKGVPATYVQCSDGTVTL